MNPKTSSDIQAVLTQPDWFLSAADIPNQSFIFQKLDEPLFEAAPFHDGRTSFTDAACQALVSFNDAAKFIASQSVQNTTDRLILHQSFCGSTFLARALSAGEGTRVYREPQILTEFCTLRGLSAAPLSSVMTDKVMMDFILSQFRKTNTAVRQTIIKPSNWANDAFTLCDAPQLKIIIAPITQSDYFIANIRGGQARIKYSLDLLNHLLRFDPAAQGVVQALSSDTTHSQMEAMFMMLAVAHHLQTQTLQRIIDKHPAQNIHHLAPNWLTRKDGLINTVLECTDFLALDHNAADTQARLAPMLQRHAKAKDEAFDAKAQNAANAALSKSYAAPIAKAKRWAKSQGYDRLL